jgi:hypothetical protein
MTPINPIYFTDGTCPHCMSKSLVYHGENGQEYRSNFDKIDDEIIEITCDNCHKEFLVAQVIITAESKNKKEKLSVMSLPVPRETDALDRLITDMEKCVENNKRNLE